MDYLSAIWRDRGENIKDKVYRFLFKTSIKLLVFELSRNYQLLI